MKKIALLALLLPALAAGETIPQQIYAQDASAVVAIIADDPSGAGHLGAGSVIDPGHILTAARVVIDSATKAAYPQVQVYLKPEKITGDPLKDLADPKPARVLRYDATLDLALLEVDGLPPKVSTMTFGDSDTVAPGQPVTAIGHPEQGGLWTLTAGTIGPRISSTTLEANANINRGDSGGPLLDMNGRMIGVNTVIAQAVPANATRQWLEPTISVAISSAAAPTQAQAPVTTPSKPEVMTPRRPYRIESLLRQKSAEKKGS